MATRSARRVFWSDTKITDGAFAGATELGSIAPGSELPDVEVLNAGPAFGFAPETGGQIGPFNLMVFGDTPEAALVTAKEASPPTYGYLHVLNANTANGYSIYWVHPLAARALARTAERAKAMVQYRFYGEADSPEELAENVDVAATFE